MRVKFNRTSTKAAAEFERRMENGKGTARNLSKRQQS